MTAIGRSVDRGGRIPAGSYRLSSHAGLQRSLSDAALIGSDDGVEFHRPADPDAGSEPYRTRSGDREIPVVVLTRQYA